MDDTTATPETTPTPTVKTWIITLLAFTLVALGIPALAAIPDLGVALVLAGIVAAALIFLERVIAWRTR